MAGDINRVILVGRLTRDPELRQVGSGANLCRFSIASNRIYTQNGEQREEVSFFNCTAWGRQAEVIHKYCQKGKQVSVDGRLRQNSWQDNDGKKHSAVEVVVDQIQFIGPIQNRSDNSPDSMMAEGNYESNSGGYASPQNEAHPAPVTVGQSGGHGFGSQSDDDIPF